MKKLFLLSLIFALALVSVSAIANSTSYNYYVSLETSVSDYVINETVYVDLMLVGDINYAQVAATITYDTALLQYAGYENLAGYVAAVNTVAPNKITVQSMATSNIVVGAPCSAGVRIVTLKFTVKDNLSSNSVNTDLTLGSVTVTPTAGVVGATTAPCEDLTLTLNKGHNWVVDQTIPPTCETQGYTIYECSFCGAFENGSFISALGHDWEEDHTVMPTCEAQGYTVYECSQCNENENDDFIAALGHNWIVKNIVPPTSSAQGYTVYKCSRCNEEKHDDYVNALELGTSIIIDAESGKQYDITLSAEGIADFSGMVITVQYDTAVFDVTDLCAFTKDEELTAGSISEAGLIITQVSSGEIKLTVDKTIPSGKLWTGVINVISLQAKITAQTTVSADQ